MFQKIVRLGLTCHQGTQNRSASEAVHLGVWQPYRKQPCIATDAWQKGSKGNVRVELFGLLHELCGYFKEHFLPRIEAIARRHMPEQYAMKDIVHKRILQAKYIKKYPNYDFGGVVSMIAMKFGSSERLHVDWFDPLHLWTFLLVSGDFQGADFQIPQCGGSVRFIPTMVLAAKTRVVLHCNTLYVGDRLGITCFLHGPLLYGGLKSATTLCEPESLPN
ncbi:hypothetical protein GGX14DRAFT_382095 [Mycena pura]|uniref:Uncharacterized protein n=1 Tax=Mycena pura TaxID=153505 RepID=A0AAD6UUD8_9AGAR|nr:hypothetical protein GGX14DRAFT_382095 [Mycena pura]